MKVKSYITSSFAGIISSRFLILNILVILILSQQLHSQTDSLIIEHITGEQDLSNSSVNFITQDREGYLWFATERGIERYDGYSFQSYLNNPEDPTSFVNVPAYSIYEDNEGVIWIGTLRGIERYDRSTNSFTNYLPDSSEKRITRNNVHMIEDKKGVFWVTTDKGFFRFNKFSGKFSQVQYDTDIRDSLNNWYGPLYVDKDGSLWVGTGRGLDKFNYETEKVLRYWHDPEKREIVANSSSKYIINSICEDKDGILWLGTGNGLVEFNKKDNTFTDFLPDSMHSSLAVNILDVLYLDTSGLLWVGTQGGIFTFNTESKKFIPKFINKSVRNYYLGNNLTTSLYIDRSGVLWVGTFSDGIYKVILKELPYKKYLAGSINEIYKGNNGILWIKRGVEGWVKFNTKTGQITPLNKNERGTAIGPDGNTYFMNSNFSILTRVKNGKVTRYDLLKKGSLICNFKTTSGMWYGTSLGGLYYVDFNTGKSREVVKTRIHITAIFEDSQGLVWAATYFGKLICYNPANKSVSEYMSDSKDPSNFTGGVTYNIYQDKKRRLWFATDAGLNRFIPSTKTFIHFTEKDGLSGNIVNNILEDKNGNLWMGTDKGITKFDPETNQFKNFDILRGLSSSHWWNHLAVKMDNGEMFFGRSYGLISFYPDSIKENNYIPPVVITSLRLFDKPVPFDKEIKFPYNKNFLSFEFAALSYYNSQRNQYAYKMEGVDKDWVYSGTRRYTSYPNLTPGKYIFRVKGSNNDGIWNEAGTSMLIIISPPWWETSWAYIFYGLIFVFTLYGIRRYELNRIRLKDKINLDAALLKEREETDRIKSRFFANISHEFRTPLTLILGPAEKIKSQTSEDIIKDSNIITRNSKRLLQLVNQLLDLSKLEAGKLKLEASKGNIVAFVKGIALSFESLSEEKDITLKIFSEKDLIEVYFDKEKMIKILSNILSNAFKFTEQNGKITISIAMNTSSRPKADPPLVESVSSSLNSKVIKEFVEIKIKDTGIGIPKEEIPKLFDRFYQVDSSFTKEHQGTGIGLALVKELVELHHGNISAQSEEGRWTEFTLNFPLGGNHLKDEEILEESKTKNRQDIIRQEEYNFQENSKEESESAATGYLRDEKTAVLIVEDNYDMREYIKDSLGEDYSVEEAINGEQGVRKAEMIIPDLIISDMMMPKMDGNELTRILKNDVRTSHIPIIILTAKSGQESKLEGLETGADDYLTKPFDIKELQVRIKNLINIRRKLQEKFRSSEYINLKTGKDSQTDLIKNLKLKGIDEKFINKVLSVIEEHISEESFSVEELRNEVGMSKAQFFRKIKALTGMPVGIYLRTVRLVKAKKMIEEKQGNISEIAFTLGFSSPSYFAKCFKDEFGYTPSNFIG